MTLYAYYNRRTGAVRIVRRIKNQRSYRTTLLREFTKEEFINIFKIHPHSAAARGLLPSMWAAGLIDTAGEQVGRNRASFVGKGWTLVGRYDTKNSKEDKCRQ